MNHLAKIVSSYREEKNEMTIISFSFFFFHFLSLFFSFSFYLLSSPHGLFFCSLATHAHERPSGRTRTLAGGLACAPAPPIPNQAPAVARSSAIAPRLVPSLAPASLTAPPLRPVSSQYRRPCCAPAPVRADSSTGVSAPTGPEPSTRSTPAQPCLVPLRAGLRQISPYLCWVPHTREEAMRSLFFQLLACVTAQSLIFVGLAI